MPASAPSSSPRRRPLRGRALGLVLVALAPAAAPARAQDPAGPARGGDGAAGADGAEDAAAQAVAGALALGDVEGARAALAAAPPLLPRRRAALALAVDAADALARGASLAPIDSRARALARVVLPEDEPLVRALERAAGPAGAALAPVRWAAQRRIASAPLEDLGALARAPDAQVRRRAVAALAERLAALRRVVDLGGELTPAEQALLADRGRLEALVAALDERPGGGASDAFPARTLTELPGLATALHALAAVEAPALRALEGEPACAPGAARAALEAVRAAERERVRRHPGSTWASARGARPAPARATTCGACGGALPDEASHCPACGVRARAACPRCAAVCALDAVACARCGVDPRAVEAAACGGCGAAVDSPFCPRCGRPAPGPDSPAERTPAR